MLKLVELLEQSVLKNGLKVLNKATFESDIEQNGGFRNSSVGVARNIFWNY